MKYREIRLEFITMPLIAKKEPFRFFKVQLQLFFAYPEVVITRDFVSNK